METKLILTNEHFENSTLVKFYTLENFNVSPFSAVGVETRTPDKFHQEVTIHFTLPLLFNGTSDYSVHMYHFSMHLTKISATIGKSELLDYVTSELLEHSNGCKIPTLYYNNYYTPNRSDYRQTIDSYIQRKYTYKPLLKVYGRARKQQSYTLQTSSNCNCFFEEFLPLNFILTRANDAIVEEIHCQTITEAVKNEIARLHATA